MEIYSIKQRGEPNKKPAIVLRAFMHGDRDSNPNKQIQNLWCYRYTIPVFHLI